MNSTKIDTVLEALGLNSTEGNILKILFENKELRATEISKKAKINRTTIYSALSSLMEKGLVTSVDEKKILMFRSIEPLLLLDYIDRQKSKLSKQQELFKEILPEIEVKRGEKNKLPKIQFFRGYDAVKQAYEDGLNNNREKEIKIIIGAQAAYTIMDEEWVHYYIHKRKSLEIKGRVIAPDSEKGIMMQNKDKVEFRETNLIPKEYAFDAEIDIYGDKTLIVSYEDPVAIIIENEHISNTLKKLFEYVWKREEEDKSKTA